MPSNDIDHLLTSSIDLYELLAISPEATQKEIDQARRKTALRYHPDKDGSDDAKNKFRVTQDACSGLSDPAWRAIYDHHRAAQRQRERQNALFEGRRKQMKEDLESRERGVKRPRNEAEDAEEKLQQEIRRLAQDGERRRREREETLRKARKDAQMTNEQARIGVTSPSATDGRSSKFGVPEIDRTVKVRWPVEGQVGSLTVEHVKKLFSKFGEIESADLLGQKMARLAGSKKKQMALTCMILYASVVGAHAAVEDFRKQREPQWQIIDSVHWAANKEPDFLNASATNGVHGSSPSTPSGKGTPDPSDSAKRFKGSITPTQSAQANSNNLNKKSSLASFSAAAASSPKCSPFGKGLGPNSPNLEEITMIRLKKLEQKRLAAEIDRQDEEADAKLGVNVGGTPV